MNDTHFKSAQNLFFLKDTVEILSPPPSILLGLNKNFSARQDSTLRYFLFTMQS